MKAILVIDVPNANLWKTSNDIYERMKGYKCSFKPMPEKKSIELACQKENDGNDYGAGLIVGWNDCIEELEK